MADRNYILGESLKPGGTARLFTKGVADLGGKIGNFFRGGDQSSSQTSTTPTKTVKQQQLQTYNSRYPGFDKEDYLRLEQLVDQKGVTGSKKAQLMDEAYQYYYPQVLNKHKLDERQNVINDWVYNNGEKLANGDQLTNAQYRLLNLTQMAKEKFDLAYNVEDGDIVRNIREKVPNGQELLRNFLSTGDPEILYATGIYDEGQKAQDFRSQKDIAQESLGGNYWKNIWNNMYANSFAPLDAFEKFTYKGLKNLQNLGLKLDDYLAGVAPQSWKDDIMGDMTLEEYRARNKEERETNKKEIDEYIKMVNDANQRNRSNTVNPIVDNYYSRRNFTDLLADGDLEGFFYKGLGDAATNWDMPVVIGASIINPAMGTALMGTNTYVRESEEAYEAMRKAGATHEQAEAGGATVGLLNTLVEIYLDRWLGGTESTTTKGVRDALKKNVLKEVSNKPIEDIIGNAATTYARSSMEEGLEEWVQNTITNAAKMTVEENPEWKDLFEGGRQAFEGGAFNPFNILSPAGDLYSNRESIKQSMMDGAYDAGVTVRNITDMFKGVPKDSGNVWQKVVETTTRNIPEKVVENELKLTPTERKNVERYGITPANFVLKENIAGLSNADKVVALQDISSDAYNNVTNIFKNVIPQDYRTESKTAGKMLKTMIDTMEKSDIVKEEYADYIAKLKEMLDYSDFSPYEKLAIRRDFDAIVGSDIFGANGRVKGLEDQTIAKWRADLNEEINQLGDEFGIDVKSENARIANAITIRDGLLRALSQNKKNNAIGLQDLGIGAILSAGNPVQAGGIIIAKRLLENAAGNIAQGLYNKNNTPLTPSNTKRGAGFIQRAGTNANNNFMISTTSSNNSINPQEELSSKTAKYQVADESDYQLQPLERIEEIQKNILDEYGETDNPGRVAFIDNEGRWINGNMGGYGNYRDVDHREIASTAFDDTDIEFNTGTDGLVALQAQTGLVRVNYNDGYMSIDTVYELMPSQREGLMRFADEDIKEVNVDITDPKTGQTLESGQFNSVKDAIRFIDKHFAKSDAKYQKYGVADPNSKSITAQEGLNIKDFRNGRTVEDIANQYGIKVDIVEKILTPAGEKALGMYDKGIITLAKDLKESTVPHELLHAVFDMVDASKRKSILDGIQKRLDVDAVQAEEWLADSFSEYYRTGNINTTSMTSTLVGKIKQFFQMIKEFIDGTYANRREIQRLFDDIIEGNSLAGDNSVMSKLDERYQRSLT